jgi:hypothetical protein
LREPNKLSEFIFNLRPRFEILSALKVESFWPLSFEQALVGMSSMNLLLLDCVELIHCDQLDCMRA